MDLKFDVIRIPRKQNDILSKSIINNNLEHLKAEINNVMRDIKDDLEHNVYSFTIIVPSIGYDIKFDYSNLKERLVVYNLDKKLKQFKYKGKITDLIDFF